MEENENVQVNEQNVQQEPKGLYIASLILGICSIVFCWIPIFAIVLGGVALAIGIVAILKMKRFNTKNGMAIAGLVTAIIGFIISIIITIFTIGGALLIYDKASGEIKANSKEIYNTTRNIVNEIEDMDETAKEAYNNRIESYVGSSKSASDVKSLINNIISSNTTNSGTDDRFITIEADDISGFDSDDLDDACEDASKNNSSSNVSSATTEMRALISKISSGKKFNVRATYDDGYIVKIIITEK